MALQFVKRGYPKVYALKGGFPEWESANFPMENKTRQEAEAS